MAHDGSIYVTGVSTEYGSKASTGRQYGDRSIDVNSSTATIWMRRWTYINTDYFGVNQRYQGFGFGFDP